MQGLWIEQGKLSLRRDLEVSPIKDQVEIKVRLAGICGTDLELLRGYYDFRGVPGHEFVGEVISKGEWQGKRVVSDINFSCGECEFCLTNEPHHCLQRTTLGINKASGAFAEVLVAPCKNLVVVPDEVPDDHAVFAEPLAAALQILEQIKLDQQSVLLVGAGRLGRMIAWVITKLQPEVALTIGVRNPNRASQMPAEAQIASVGDLKRNFDVAIDCTGSPEGFAAALGLLKAKGKLVVKSTYAEELKVDMSRVVVDEIEVIGSRCGPMPQAVEFLRTYPEVIAPTERELFALEDFAAAFAAAQDAEVDKVLFQF